MADKEPLDDFDKQPAAADECRQGLDDPALTEFVQKTPEGRLAIIRRRHGSLVKRAHRLPLLQAPI